MLPSLLNESVTIVLTPVNPDCLYLGPFTGGTTAGIVVGRLAAADPSLRILILEAGPHTQDDLAHIQPARFLTHLQPGSKTVRNVIARPSEHLDGRELAVQCGQCVGGGSSVNCKFSGLPCQRLSLLR